MPACVNGAMTDIIIVMESPTNNGDSESSGRPTLQPFVSENIKKTKAKVPTISARKAFMVETVTSYPNPGLG
ncbi:MAG: hypothetical protein OEM80_04230 [Desulfobulbaceae bacterium]|jgi:hypothetical protein|nr:hypothetical protein [Desulfobulbaceae bacterium]